MLVLQKTIKRDKLQKTQVNKKKMHAFSIMYERKNIAPDIKKD